MLDRRRFALGLLAVLNLALALRALPLYWSPYLATLDGFKHAVDAREALRTGSIALEGFRAEDFHFTSLIAVAGAVLGIRPLLVLQPLMAPVGVTAVLAGIAVVHRVGHSTLSRRDARLAAVLAGLLLAVSGIYLRRTLVPDTDIVAHAFVPLLALAWYRFLRAGRRAWFGVAAVLFLLFPLVHTLSSLVAMLTVAGVTVGALVAGRLWRRVAIGSVVVAGFWAYVAGYYGFAQAHPLLTVSYVDRVTSHPGLFLAWVVLLMIGIAWFQTTSSRLRQVVLAAPFLVAFVLLAANEVVTVFPGTIPTPSLLLVLMALYLVMVAFAVRAWDRLPARGSALVILALLGAPVVVMYFALTASLTPGYFAMALRGHTFVYLPLLGLAALAVVTVGRPGRRSVLRGLLAVVLVASVAGTAPLAYADLDTMAFPHTTTPVEFEATTFAGEHTSRVVTDHPYSRLVGFFTDGTARVAPLRRWLTGGPPPDGAMLSRRAWTRTGAHFFPGAPLTVSSDRYEAALRCRHVVYATTTRDSLVVTRPSSTARSASGCRRPTDSR